MPLRKDSKKRPFLDESKKQAYKGLAEQCVFYEKSRSKILDFIETMGDYEGDEDYYTTLNYFIDFLDEDKNLNFIIRLDCSSGVEDFEWLLGAVLRDNFIDRQIVLSTPSEYDEDTTVSHDGLFKNYDNILRKNGLQLGFIDTKSDEYIITAHDINDRKKVAGFVNKIGYDYFDVDEGFKL